MTTHFDEHTFKPHVRERFGFLVSNYGFRERARDDDGPYRILFEAADIAILVESTSWGTSARVGLGHPSRFEDFDLEDLLSLRGVPEIEGENPAALLDALADALRATGEDVLRGDTSDFRRLARIVRRRERAQRFGVRDHSGRKGILGVLESVVRRILY